MTNIFSRKSLTSQTWSLARNAGGACPQVDQVSKTLYKQVYGRCVCVRACVRACVCVKGLYRI